MARQDRLIFPNFSHLASAVSCLYCFGRFQVLSIPQPGRSIVRWCVSSSCSRPLNQNPCKNVALDEIVVCQICYCKIVYKCDRNTGEKTKTQETKVSMSLLHEQDHARQTFREPFTCNLETESSTCMLLTCCHGIMLQQTLPTSRSTVSR